MKTAYDNHPNTQLFLDYAENCTSVLDLFEKIKKLNDTILQGNITEGLVKVMLDSQKFFKMNKVDYSETNQEGIDIVCEHKRHGKITVQVKFRSSETLSNDDLNSFGKVNWLKGYDYGYVIGNLRDVPSDWHNDKVMLFLKEDFRDINLQDLVEFASVEKAAAPTGPLTPRGFQSIWLEQMRSNINKMSRGKILGPPGIGKTFGIASYVRMLKKNKLGYIGAPWIRLVNQNVIGVVTELEANGFNVDFIVVNSSDSVKTSNSESGELNRYNIVKPTTNEKEIRDFIKNAKKDKTAKNLYIVFACYGSTEKIIKSFKGYRLNYGVFDEAHNLTGHNTKTNPQLLYRKNVKFSRMAFVTATEKTYNGENDQIVAMNNAKLFGGILCFCSFKDAIKYKNIKDYRVIFPKLNGEELDGWFTKLMVNAYVQDNGEPVTMDMVATKAMIYAMFYEYPITRMVAGFNKIDNAREMSKFLAVQDPITDHFGFVVKSTWVSSKESQSENNRRIGEFADSQEKYVLCAPPMLKEGVDIKGIDKNGKAQYPNSVVFCENKRGEVGIVQLAGRGMRMGQNPDEICYIGLPIIYHPKKGQEEVYNRAFERAKEVIISLACSDDRIAQEVKTIRVGKTPSKLYKTSTKIVEIPTPIADDVSFSEFINNLSLSCVRSLNSKKSSLSDNDIYKIAKDNNAKKESDVRALLKDHDDGKYSYSTGRWSSELRKKLGRLYFENGGSTFGINKKTENDLYVFAKNSKRKPKTVIELLEEIKNYGEGNYVNSPARWSPELREKLQFLFVKNGGNGKGIRKKNKNQFIKFIKKHKPKSYDDLDNLIETLAKGQYPKHSSGTWSRSLSKEIKAIICTFKKDKYRTKEETSDLCIKNGLVNGGKYFKYWVENKLKKSLFPSDPIRVYKDKNFFESVREKCPISSKFENSTVVFEKCVQNKITNHALYFDFFKKNNLLKLKFPSRPHKTYKDPEFFIKVRDKISNIS